jgi:hypothetical protein
VAERFAEGTIGTGRLGLRRRHAAMVAGPGRPGEVWRNWVVRRRADGAAVGTVVEAGAGEIVAHVHPDHLASARVAAAAGLVATADEVDGERVWRLRLRTGG